MKENYSFMGSRELKEFFRLIEKQYGKVPEHFEKLAFIRGKENIYTISDGKPFHDRLSQKVNHEI